MNRRAIYIDSNSHETMHEQYNAAMFLVCAYSFNDITYYAGRSSLSHTSKLIAASGMITYNKKKIFVFGGNNKISLLLRTIISCTQNIRFLLFSKKGDILIYNFNNFLSLFFINYLNKLLKRKVIIFCHSELGFIVNDCVHKNIIYNLRTKIFRNIFLNPKTKIADNLYFAVLGDSIKFNLSKILSIDKANHIISIDHPYIFKKSIASIGHQGLKFGVVGTMAQEKGADILIEIAKKIDLKNRTDILISIIGRILCETKQFMDAGIVLPDNLGQESLPRDEFNNRISELDYILYLYPVNSYKFTASGSLMDSLNMECPALSFRNDYFQYIFEKFGKFGYLVENVSDMVLLINALSKGVVAREDYPYKEIKIKLSPSEIKNDFVSKLTLIGFIKQ
jgi:hypothetical protein